MRTWVDASTLIALDVAGAIGILKDLVGRIAITDEISKEVFRGKESTALREAREDWITIVRMRGDRGRWRRLGLGAGEASLFLTPREDRLILDEIPARIVAEAEGRSYAGLLGLLVEGARAGRISPGRAIEVLRKLVRGGLHLSTDLYDSVLAELRSER